MKNDYLRIKIIQLLTNVYKRKNHEINQNQFKYLITVSNIEKEFCFDICILCIINCSFFTEIIDFCKLENNNYYKNYFLKPTYK